MIALPLFFLFIASHLIQRTSRTHPVCRQLGRKLDVVWAATFFPPHKVLMVAPSVVQKHTDDDDDDDAGQQAIRNHQDAARCNKFPSAPLRFASSPFITISINALQWLHPGAFLSFLSRNLLIRTRARHFVERPSHRPSLGDYRKCFSTKLQLRNQSSMQNGLKNFLFLYHHQGLCIMNQKFPSLAV